MGIPKREKFDDGAIRQPPEILDFNAFHGICAGPAYQADTDQPRKQPIDSWEIVFDATILGASSLERKPNVVVIL